MKEVIEPIITSIIIILLSVFAIIGIIKWDSFVIKSKEPINYTQMPVLVDCEYKIVNVPIYKEKK